MPDRVSTPAAKRQRPAERPVDPALRLALALLLHARHQGRERAATWAGLAEELEAEGMHVTNVRRLQEAARSLLEEDGAPIVGLSSDGVWWAETAEEIEEALRECESRARMALRRRRLLRRVWLEMRGQESILAVEKAS